MRSLPGDGKQLHIIGSALSLPTYEDPQLLGWLRTVSLCLLPALLVNNQNTVSLKGTRTET